MTGGRSQERKRAYYNLDSAGECFDPSFACGIPSEWNIEGFPTIDTSDLPTRFRMTHRVVTVSDRYEDRYVAYFFVKVADGAKTAEDLFNIWQNPSTYEAVAFVRAASADYYVGDNEYSIDNVKALGGPLNTNPVGSGGGPSVAFGALSANPADYLYYALIFTERWPAPSSEWGEFVYIDFQNP